MEEVNDLRLSPGLRYGLAAGDSTLTLTHISGGTIYYGGSAVTSTSNDGSISNGSSVTVSVDKFVISTERARLLHTRDASGLKTLFRSARPVTSHIGDVTLAQGSKTVEIDEYGNVFFGPNELIKGRDTSDDPDDWDPDFGTSDFWYDSMRRRVRVRTMSVVEVGDPPDLLIGRYGADNEYPLGSEEGTADDLSGVPADNNLGTIRWFGAATPQGGTPDVTAGARFRGSSVTIKARAAENIRTTAPDTHALGGHLIFGTCPVGSATTVDRVRISSEGKMEFGDDFAVNLYPSSGALKTDDKFIAAGEIEIDGAFNHDGSTFGALGATPAAQRTTVADASVAHALNATFSDTEVETALDALGTKINSILATLEVFGFHATA